MQDVFLHDPVLDVTFYRRKAVRLGDYAYSGRFPSPWHPLSMKLPIGESEVSPQASYDVSERPILYGIGSAYATEFRRDG